MLRRVVPPRLARQPSEFVSPPIEKPLNEFVNSLQHLLRSRNASDGELLRESEQNIMRVHSKPVQEHEEVPHADEGRWEALVTRWKEREVPNHTQDGGQNACYVVSVRRSGNEAHAPAQLKEIVALVQSQGDQVVGSMSHELVRPDPRTLIRRGVAAEIAECARDSKANMLVIDAELSPSQTRNLEDVTGLPICDREAVILNVFQKHATSRRARRQVEIAHLEYLRPRIRGIGLNMDQQAGGVMGSRGPGETASELLARQLDARIVLLKSSLTEIKRADQAKRRRRQASARIALVGYTNAGKTSLMNALAQTRLSSRDRPFETLDATSRCLTRHGGDILLSDTVGFIRRLPERLFASFESTLAEAVEASLLLIVVDISDPEHKLHLNTTHDMLVKLGADAIPRFYAFTKTDLLSEPMAPEVLSGLSRDFPYQLLSSLDAQATARLRAALISHVREGRQRRTLFVPYDAKDVIQSIYAACRVVKAEACENGLLYTIEGSEGAIQRVVRLAEREQE